MPVRNRRRLLSHDEGIREIWPSFTDVMSTMALVLFVLVLLSYVRSLVASKHLDALQKEIAASQLQLDSLRSQIQRDKTDLGAAQAALDKERAASDETGRQLDAVRSQLRSIAVLRVGVLDKLKKAIEAELGPSADGGADRVTVGDNGSIIINESLVFEYNSAAIKKEAQPLLETLARAFGNVLADPDVRANVDTILIQGHTDERGSASVNWDLSARRATAVLDYLFHANTALADSYGSYFAAAAYSKFRPIDTSQTEAAYQKNRRIEISIVPKDDTVRQVVDAYARDSAAPATPPAAP